MNSSSLDPKARTAGHQTARYTISDHEMAVGSTLGGPKVSTIIKATGAIEKVFSPEAGVDVFGTLVLHHWDAQNCVPLTPRQGIFEVFPEKQQHVFELSNGVDVAETIFVLSGKPSGPERRDVDPPGVYYALELHNAQDREVRLASYASIQLRCGLGGTVHSAYDHRDRAFVVTNSNQPGLARVAYCSPAPTSYEVTSNSAKASATAFPGNLPDKTLDSDDNPIAIFHFDHTLQPGARAKFEVVLTFSPDGVDAAKANARKLPDSEKALERTESYYRDVMDRAILLTPDAEVNRGALWAKANILRTQSLTTQGWNFVNDPTRSNNSVGRDTAWYAFGAGYISPEFCGEALLWYLDHLEPRGMVVEYFDIRNGKTNDYGLNINDNTPLLILALWHHYCVTGDRKFLQYVYAHVQPAAQYILSVRNDQGLVWCTADGTADWGIVGWRNVIEGYRLSGATTEVNSECYAALQTMSKIAAELGDAQAASRYRSNAEELKAAINEHLLDKERNLYYLNIDVDGTPRTDVTCDLVFPVMFGVADRDVAANIIARLSAPEFWTDAGMHTVPRNDINYGPTHGYGLLGGVWSGPTFWFAFAAGPFNPEFMAYALSTSFKHYAQDPRRNNTVPGQFSEWLHGETLANQGMMLSPWFAPKYLWSALEGAAGLDVAAVSPCLHPRPADTWQWIAARNVMVRGRDASWFAVRIDGLQVYTDYPFEGIDKARIFEQDVTQDVRVSGDTAAAVAFTSPGKLTVFAGNTFDRTVMVAVSVDRRHLRSGRTLRIYSTLRNEWIEEKNFDEDRLRNGLPIQISRHGFCLLELGEGTNDH